MLALTMSQYASDHSVAGLTLNDARSRIPVLDDLLRSCTAKSGTTHLIEDYLIMPIQRTPRYELVRGALNFKIHFHA